MCLSSPSIPDPPAPPPPAPKPPERTAVQAQANAKVRARSRLGRRLGTSQLRVPLQAGSGSSLNAPR